MKKETIAIITARGGSKRIPKKNIKSFCGKPIIAYSIETALQADIFNEIMVSTDDPIIAEIAKQYGAKVPFMRSEKTSNDYATTVDVLLEVLDNYQKKDIYFNKMCCLYPTAPFTTVGRLKEAMNLLDGENIDSVITVTEFSFPPMRGMYVRNGDLEYCYPEYMNQRSQDIETMYHDCGQFYCMNVDAFQNQRKIIMNHTKPIIVPEHEVQDIDTMEDWILAEIKYKLVTDIQRK